MLHVHVPTTVLNLVNLHAQLFFVVGMMAARRLVGGDAVAATSPARPGPLLAAKRCDPSPD